MKFPVPEPEIKGFAVVRDEQGNVKCDDPDNLPSEIIAMLSEADKQHLGLSNANT